MHSELFYHRNTSLAYVLFPGCDDVETVYYEIRLLRANLRLNVPAIFEVRRIAEGPHWGKTVLKFIIDPEDADLLRFTDITPDIAKQLIVEPYKLGRTQQFYRKPQNE